MVDYEYERCNKNSSLKNSVKLIWKTKQTKNFASLGWMAMQTVSATQSRQTVKVK